LHEAGEVRQTPILNVRTGNRGQTDRGGLNRGLTLFSRDDDFFELSRIGTGLLSHRGPGEQSREHRCVAGEND
jgi:hypothetical protein